MKKGTTQLSATPGSPLFLQVEPLCPHCDSVICLGDPIIIKKLTEDENHADKNEGLHSFTALLAPIALAFYLIGHYLNTYHASHTVLNDVSGDINLDPMFGGYALIGTDLLIVKWDTDQAFLSPV